MSTKPSGYGTMEIGGATRGFHVGIEQGEVFASLPNRRREDGRPMSLKAFDAIFSPTSLSQNELSGGEVRDFVYSALAQGARIDGQPFGFTPQDISAFIDQADANEVAKPFKEMLAQLLVRYGRQLERLKKEGAPKSKKTAGPKRTKN